jgi:hemolysin D
MSIRHRVAAYGELLTRYKLVFMHAWRHRQAMGGNIFNEQEAEFLPAALALQEKPVSSTARLTARLLMALLAILLVWAVFGQVDIIVNATGKVIPSARTKTIASVDVASVRALHVVEGQHVKAGDVLVELDSSASDAERDKAVGDQSDAFLQTVRAKALIAAIDSGRPAQLPALAALQPTAYVSISAAKWQAEQSHLEGLQRDFLARLSRIDGDIERYRQALPLATERAQDYQALLKNHDVAQHAWLEKEQARIDLAGQLAEARHQRAALIAETRRMAYDQLTEGSKLAAASQQDAIRSGARSQLLKLTAPVEGIVQQLTVHTVGGVVPAAQPLMQIVPVETAVEVEAFLDNKDIGFVRPGETAQVKIDAFEYTRYGTIPATVTHVSRDAIQDEKRGLIYAAKVMLGQSVIAVEGKLMPLSPGMSVNVEIKTGSRRIIEYVLSPLMQHQREALHER